MLGKYVALNLHIERHENTQGNRIMQKHTRKMYKNRERKVTKKEKEP